MLPVQQKWLKILAVAITVLFIGLAVVGGIINYSPVPFWDMWDGYLGFYTQAKTGTWHVWWQQHNEHRIVLTRLFFWADLAWFNGAGWFLILVNYVLVGFSCCIFYLFLREQKTIESKNAIPFIGLFLFAWLFSWSQDNNLTWGFQSQFILAQLLPLCAFYCMHRAASSHTNEHAWYTLACISGIASVGTMANGILALPLMLLLSILLRLGWKKSLFLCLLAACSIGAYFYDSRPNSDHGSLQQTLLTDPIGMLRYVLLYIGGPFYHLTGKGKAAQWLAQGAGLFLIASSVGFAIHALRQRTRSSLALALLVFILYIGGTAFGTAGGRLVFGLDKATSSRYMTPALMAWAGLLILYAPYLISTFLSKKRRVVWSLIVLSLLMLSRQVTALRPNHSELFERKVAALALELRIKDEAQIKMVYPSAEVALRLTEQPVKNNLSIFGLEPIKDAGQVIGTTDSTDAVSACIGRINGTYAIPGENRYAKIYGQLYDNNSESTSDAVRLVSGQGTIIGYAITGKPKSDSAITVGAKDGSSNFKGYILIDYLGQQITMLGLNPRCSLAAFAPYVKQ